VVSERIFAEFLTTERVLGGAVALILHVAVLLLLASSITFRVPDVRPVEQEIVALVPRVPPPPPEAERIGPSDVAIALPRFRPRMPAAVPTRQQRQGDPALAIWSYLCNRDAALSEAVRRGCPSFDFGAVGLSLLGPLNRTGDIGALFGADTTTMSLDEAAVARGWIKPPPPKGQTGLAARTDKSHPDPNERFGPLPWDESGTKGTPYSWSKDRAETVGEGR